jgi:serine phosphatase RsbU (regulator of sigma subunit)
MLAPGAPAIACAAAGNPPPMLRRADGSIERIDVGGLALTWMPRSFYATVTVPFSTGDRLLLFTDGLLEASWPGSDAYFGDAGLAPAVAALDGSAGSADAVIGALRHWIGGETPLADDVTLVVIEKRA